MNGHFSHLRIALSLVSKYQTQMLFNHSSVSFNVNGRLNHRKLAAFFWDVGPKVSHPDIFLKKFTDSIRLYFLRLLLYFLSFSATWLTDGLSTLSSWLPHRSELTTKCSEGRANKSLTFPLSSLSSSFLIFSSFSSSSSYTFTDILHGMCVFDLDPTIKS